MERESFEDLAVAEALNKHYVNVKVDREERPDIDEAYMTAVQLSSGRGGWPMSVFMTPERKPFFAATYFPKANFAQVVAQVAGAWSKGRKELLDAADEFSKALAEVLTKPAPGTFAKLDEDFVEQSVRAIASDFDSKNGGFGTAPKFPPHGAIQLLMSYALRPQSRDELREAALGMALATLERISRGGIRDHIGGGFHRYSTDEVWLLPHFEKMLYDNALMLGNLVHGSAIAAQIDPDLESLLTDAAQDLIGWVGREMVSPEGLFYSALDADSEGEEGKFYVWTSAQVREVLAGEAEGFLAAYGFEDLGNYRDESKGEQSGNNIPFLADPSFQPKDEIKKLRSARQGRPTPALDHKAIVAWNGLMISAFVDSGRMVEAERTCDAILAAEAAYGRLPHQISNDVPGGNAFLDDYAAFVDALLKLGSTAELLAQLQREAPEEFAGMGLKLGKREGRLWLEHGARLCHEMVERFYDEEHGAFFSTASDHEVLFGRTKPVFDQPIPSGNALALRCLLAIGDRERASKTVESLLGWMQKAPQATEALLSAALPLVPAAAVENGKPSAKVISADVEVTLSAKELQVDEKGWAHAEVVIMVPDGLHINGPQPPARWLIPTSLEIQPLKSAVDYPVATSDEYTGEVRIPFRVELPSSEKAAEFEIKVGYQACTSTECMEPKERTLSAVVLR